MRQTTNQVELHRRPGSMLVEHCDYRVSATGPIGRSAGGRIGTGVSGGRLGVRPPGTRSRSAARIGRFRPLHHASQTCRLCHRCSSKAHWTASDAICSLGRAANVRTNRPAADSLCSQVNAKTAALSAASKVHCDVATWVGEVLDALCGEIVLWSEGASGHHGRRRVETHDEASRHPRNVEPQSTSRCWVRAWCASS